MATHALLRTCIALLGLAAAAHAAAAETGAAFGVTVRLQQPAQAINDSSSGLCGTTVSRSVVSIGCRGAGSTLSTPLQVMAFTNRENLVSTFDVYAGGARILGWQVLSLDDRDYLELTLGW